MFNLFPQDLAGFRRKGVRPRPSGVVSDSSLRPERQFPTSKHMLPPFPPSSFFSPKREYRRKIAYPGAHVHQECIFQLSIPRNDWFLEHAMFYFIVISICYREYEIGSIILGEKDNISAFQERILRFYVVIYSCIIINKIIEIGIVWLITTLGISV